MTARGSQGQTQSAHRQKTKMTPKAISAKNARRMRQKARKRLRVNGEMKRVRDIDAYFLVKSIRGSINM